MSGESNTFGYNENKQKFERIESDGNHALKVFQVNSSSGGSGGDLKARSDIADPNTSTFLNCDTNGHLEVNIIGRDNAGDQSLHNCKVNDNGELFTVLRPSHFTTLPTLNNGQGHGLIFDNKARLLTKSTLSGLTNIADETTVKNVRVNTIGEVATTSHIKATDSTNTERDVKCLSDGTLLVDDVNSGNLRRTFTEGQDPSINLGNGATLTTGFSIMGGCDNVNSNFDQVNPIRVDTDGKVNVFSSTGDIADLRNVGNGKSVATLSNEINDKLTDGTQQVKVMGNSGGSNVQVLVDPSGNVNTMPRQPNRGNILISSNPISTWNDNVSCDLIAMENYSCATIHIVFVSTSLSEDDAFVVEGTDDDSNFYPLSILRPRKGFIKSGTSTNDFILESIYVPYAKFRITNKSGTNQALHNSDGAFVQVHDSAMNNFNKDNEGALLTAGNIVRGTIPSVPSPWNSGTTTGSIDVGHHKTLNFHLGGIINTHSGIIVQGSNDNSTFVKAQTFTSSPVGTDDAVRGSITRGYRYYRFENAGNSITTAGQVYSFNHYD